VTGRLASLRSARIINIMKERRRQVRRQRLVRNLFAYLNRRDLFRKGRRKDEAKYHEGADWFEREENRSG